MKALLSDKENRQFCVDSLMIQNKPTSPEIAWALTLSIFFSVVTNTAYIKVKFDAADELSNAPQSKDHVFASRHPRLQSMIEPLRRRQIVQDQVTILQVLVPCRIVRCRWCFGRRFGPNLQGDCIMPTWTLKWLTFQWRSCLNFKHCPLQRGFKFIVPIVAFMRSRMWI
jgi:hypothetical protein